MCIAVPAEVIEICNQRIGIVDYGNLRQEIRIDLVDICVGDFVLVHAGFAIQKISSVEGRDVQSLLREITSQEE